jgi:ATP-dependent Clp protease adapter protein ClpS
MNETPFTVENPDIEIKSTFKPKKPKMQRIMFLNDDFTHAVFVVKVMVELFSKSLREAEYLTMTIHQKGRDEVFRAGEPVMEVKVKQLEEMIQRDKQNLSYEVEDVTDED